MMMRCNLLPSVRNLETCFCTVKNEPIVKVLDWINNAIYIKAKNIFQRFPYIIFVSCIFKFLPLEFIVVNNQ